MTAPKVHILTGSSPYASIACEELAWGCASSRVEDATCLNCVQAELAKAREARAQAQKQVEALLPVERRLARKNRRRKA